MEKKIGETFLSKVTGKLVVTLDSPPSYRRCLSCVYNSNSKRGSCYGLMHVLRQEEVGHCSSRSRKDHKDVYFKEVESLYVVSKETLDLIQEIHESRLSGSEIDDSPLIMLLLDAEFEAYKNKEGGDDIKIKPL